MRLVILLISVSALCVHPAACGPTDTLRLELERAVWLESHGAMNLSGLALGDDGYLYFTDDNGPAPAGWQPENPVFLRISVDALLESGTENPVLEVLQAGSGSAYASLADSVGKRHKFDLEGVAAVGSGRLWATDERDRLLIEYDIASGALRPLAGYGALASWHEQLADGGINNGFEGIALLGNHLFLAHEMYPNLIVRYKLDENSIPAAEKVIEIKGSSDITGLASRDGALYALGRTGSMVYRLAPKSGEVTAVATFGNEADDLRFRYRQRMDFFRNSEGLAVGGGRIFIVLDGNFQPNMEDEQQRRPLLLVYRRPEGF